MYFSSSTKCHIRWGKKVFSKKVFYISLRTQNQVLHRNFFFCVCRCVYVFYFFHNLKMGNYLPINNLDFFSISFFNKVLLNYGQHTKISAHFK